MKIIRQASNEDCGPAVIAMLHNHYYRAPVDLADVIARCPSLQNGLTVTDLEVLGSTFGLRVEAYAGECADLVKALQKGPVVMLQMSAAVNHYVIVERRNKHFRIYDPALGVSIVEDIKPLFGGVYMKTAEASVKEIPLISVGKNFRMSLPYLLVCLGLNALSVAAAVIGGRYFQLVIEQAIDSESVANLIALSGTFLLIYFVHSLTGALQGLYRNRHLAGLYYEQMTELIALLSYKRHVFFTNANRAELLSLDQYCLTWNAHYVLGFTDLVGDTMVVGAATVAIATIDYRFLLIALAAVFVQLAIALVEWSWKRGRISRGKQISDQYKNATLSLVDSKINAFDLNQVQRVAATLKHNLQQQTDFFKSDGIFGQGADFARATAQNLGFVVAIVVGSLLIIQSRLSSVAQITYFLAMTGLMKEAAAGSFNWIVSIPAAKQAWKVIKTVQAGSSLPSQGGKGEEAVRVQRVMLDEVCFAYGSRTVFDNLNMTLQSSTLISGRSGSGKSTLARIIAGDSAPTSGTVSFGTPASQPLLSLNSNRVAVLTHEPVFDEAKLVQTASSDDRLRAAIMAVMGLHQGQQSLDNLSAGQRQVLKVMEFLDAQAMVLVFDEALANVDPSLKHLVFQTVVKKIQANNCVIWISHDEDLDPHFDHHVRLGVDHGQGD